MTLRERREGGREGGRERESREIPLPSYHRLLTTLIQYRNSLSILVCGSLEGCAVCLSWPFFSVVLDARDVEGVPMGLLTWKASACDGWREGSSDFLLLRELTARTELVRFFVLHRRGRKSNKVGSCWPQRDLLARHCLGICS